LSKKALLGEMGPQPTVGDLIECLAVDGQLQRFPHPRIVGQRRAEIARRVRLPGLVVQIDADRVEAQPGDAGDLEAAFFLEARGVGGRHEMHDVDVPGPQVGQPDVVVGDDAEHDAVELRRRLIEVVRGALDHDPVLRHALDELPRAHAHRRGAELVSQLLVGRRRDRHAGSIGQLRGQR
jgi:hypothetical protein